jgi:outer membrane receptor protein involved in Fe transport
MTADFEGMNVAAVLIVSLSLMAASPPVLAADSESASIIEEVLVTATRRETQVMETPFSMQVFGGEELDQQNIFEVRDLYDYIPGITMQEDNAQTDHTVQMRGSGISSVGPDDGQSPLGYYLDDIPFLDITSQVAPPLDYFDVQRIEVLRGPQGTSYGQDSAGGSIRIYTNDPDLEEFGFKVRGYLSATESVDDNGWQGSAVINVPIVEGKFGLRGSYSQSYSPGHGSVTSRPDIDNPTQADLQSYRLKALWRPSDTVDVTLAHSRWDTEIDWFASPNVANSENGKLSLIPLDNRVALVRFPSGVPDNTHEIEWSSLVVNWDMGFAQLTSSTGYMDAPNRQFNWGTSPFGVGILFDVPNEAFTQEIRLVSKQEGPLQWLGGVYYHDADSGTIGIVDIDFGSFEQTYVASTPRTSEAYAIYGEVSYEINEQWVVLAGLRYQDDDREAINIQEERDPLNDPLGGSTGGVPELGMYTGPRSVDERNTFSFENTNPRINVTYYPRENGMVYLNAATAFRAPIFVRGQQQVDLELAGLSGLVSQDGTEISTVEVGTKWTFFDSRLELQGAIALADWQDVPIGVSWEVDENGDGVADRTAGGPISGADAEILSVEWQVSWRATDALTLGYNGSRTDGEITDDKSDAPGVINYPPVLMKGGDLPNLADWTHSVNVRYAAPLFDTGWDLFGSANYAYRSKPEAADPAVPSLIPAEANWESVRLALGVSRGPYTIDLSISNLTDFDEPYTPGSSASTTGMIVAPRSYQLRFTYDGFAR